MKIGKHFDDTHYYEGTYIIHVLYFCVPYSTRFYLYIEAFLRVKNPNMEPSTIMNNYENWQSVRKQL